MTVPATVPRTLTCEPFGTMLFRNVQNFGQIVLVRLLRIALKIHVSAVQFCPWAQRVLGQPRWSSAPAYRQR